MTAIAGRVAVWATAVGASLAAGPDVDSVYALRGASVPLGAFIGLGLFALFARRGVSIKALRRAPRRRLAARSMLLTGGAAFEEAVWRGLVLGLLMPLGAVAALAVSSGLFALAHARRLGVRCWVHAVTGAAFGATYLVTGSLFAAIAAHSTYNVAIGAALLAGNHRPFRSIDARAAPA